MITHATPTEASTLATLRAVKTLGCLKHLLSPLEEAAFAHAYKPFNYSMRGHSLYISAWGCRELMESTSHKLKTLETLEYQDRLCATVSPRHREALFDPRVILSLPPRLRNRLCRLECYSLFAIMRKGRAFFEKEQRFTASAMKALEQAFKIREAKQLFQ